LWNLVQFGAGDRKVTGSAIPSKYIASAVVQRSVASVGIGPKPTLLLTAENGRIEPNADQRVRVSVRIEALAELKGSCLR